MLLRPEHDQENAPAALNPATRDAGPSWCPGLYVDDQLGAVGARYAGVDDVAAVALFGCQDVVAVVGFAVQYAKFAGAAVALSARPRDRGHRLTKNVQQ